MTVMVSSSSPKIAIVIYSMHGHINKLAECVKEGIERAGGSATIYQIPETLPETILTKMHAQPKPDLPIITLDKLVTFDAFLFGIPNRYGSYPAQWKTFWDSTGKLWKKCALDGKYAGFFVSTSAQGGGQEETIMHGISTLVHHGMNYVPLGYKHSFNELTNLDEARGGSPWGSGTFAGENNLRPMTELEKELGRCHGAQFFSVVNRVNF